MKAILISVAVSGIIIIGAFMLSNNNDVSVVNGNNISIVDGKQIIEINARGGYQPRKSIAKAGIPTIIRFKTNNTFDCSSSIRISSLNLFKNLPQTGSTDIDIGNGKLGILQGSCGMGMYPFEIDFQS